ncbi:xanthine dehydrogenase accessory protein XdhC [Rhodoplanes sp. TEM]|uniref:Xanthine dehydrogenase accessory protein XdhC n=1 Tax=Rhodoplanes tepidamans TaxID=200616 RepID=A0ABT5JH93_RHOTP|nr:MULTISPECIES: xanthine dehydrogenase accessory protein XdhC [Rhodoplanes]MDC7789076.1 xanthine dehydrogenase accessory protein XdhC [Rhodoplanes tepidamans]MDC7986663.1 xanthine dehydrogenase accessory protein XdhC [Rhodoplanes sp. TEM]MDQ0354438.1 xanthine dehydrogenase accessory factor [Rhodoplanes tepidamans]
MAVWARIAETIARHGRAALVSVVRVAGSSPREAGARLVARPDGGFWGTIGGGRLEYEVLAETAAALAKPAGARATFRTWTLGPDLAQCCGGVVTTLTEIFDGRDQETVAALAAAERGGPFSVIARLGDDGDVRREIVATPAAAAVRTGRPEAGDPFPEAYGDELTPVLLFGAGHVGRALVLALAPLPFAVRWIDSRADAFPAHVPANAVPVHSETPDLEVDAAPAGALALVMTHAHATDYAIATRALFRDSFDLVGMIGSATKRARFASQARGLGLPEEAIARLVCPIGLPEIGGKTPAVIAASVAAQLLVARERLGAVPRREKSRTI